MKHCILRTEASDVFFPEDASIDKYYGAFSPKNKEKYFITCTGWHTQTTALFCLRTLKHLTAGDGSPTYYNHELFGLIETLLTFEFLVYEFDIPEGLFEWLLKTDN